MSNEEMVAQIQGGRTELINDLWEQIVDYIAYRADKYLLSFPDQYKSYKDDMINESYLWMLKAVEKYDADGGKTFAGYLIYFLQKAFSTAIFGCQTDRKDRKPLNTAKSIDAPINSEGAEDITLADTLIDEAAERYFDEFERSQYQDDVMQLLTDGIEHIKDQDARKLLRCMLENDCSRMTAVRMINGGSAAKYDAYSHRYNRAIKELRQYMKKTTTRKRAELIGLDYAVYAGGARKYMNKQFTSDIEDFVIKKVDEYMKWDRIESTLN